MEISFNSGWGSDSALNQFFYDYEKNVLSDHLLSLSHQTKGLISKPGEKPFAMPRSQGDESTVQDQTQYILFENESKKHLKAELNNLPNIMENPY
jgi:hypothetical protein